MNWWTIAAIIIALVALVGIFGPIVADELEDWADYDDE